MTDKTTSDGVRNATVPTPEHATTKAGTDTPTDVAQTAFDAARCASPKPRVTVRQRTVRLPIEGAAPIVRLLQALGCPLSPETERWLHHESSWESDRQGSSAEHADAAV